MAAKKDSQIPTSEDMKKAVEEILVAWHQEWERMPLFFKMRTRDAQQLFNPSSVSIPSLEEILHSKEKCLELGRGITTNTLNRLFRFETLEQLKEVTAKMVEMYSEANSPYRPCLGANNIWMNDVYESLWWPIASS